jgi:uncharacterized membrane protein
MSARWWISGPSLGPLHTTLASGRIGHRRHGSWWSHRFAKVSYWLFGVWAIEAAVWAVVVLAMLTAAVVAAARAHRKAVQASAGSGSVTP